MSSSIALPRVQKEGLQGKTARTEGGLISRDLLQKKSRESWGPGKVAELVAGGKQRRGLENHPNPSMEALRERSMGSLKWYALGLVGAWERKDRKGRS